MTKSPDFHATEVEEVLRLVDTGPNGLSEQQAEERRRKLGFNELAQAPPPSRVWMFLGQFNSAVIWLLIIAAIVSGVLGEWIDTAAILAIVVLNGVLGFLQEDKSQRALAALEKLSAPVAHVRRGKSWETIPAREVVPGDRVRLEAGDYVPADVRLMDAASLTIAEASLTGESVPVEKQADELLEPRTALADRTNMAYLGTTVTAGKAEAIVVATGMNTEMGHIAGLLNRSERESTPLERRMDELGKLMMIVCLVLVAIIFGLQLWRGGDLVEVFLVSVSLAVAAVPEGLPAVVTLALALGLERMIRRNALVRKLPSVETLGAVTVICSDKTGTLTRNEMTVREVVTPSGRYHVTGVGFDPKGSFHELTGDGSPTDATQLEKLPAANPADRIDLSETLLAAARCTTVQVREDGEKWNIIGDPTEAALVIVAMKAELDLEKASDELIHELPFDSERKAMSMVFATRDGQRMFTKGAPEVVLGRSTHFQREGQLHELTDADRRRVLDAAAAMARRALRVLGLAQRDFPTGNDGPYEEQQLTFLGLVGMIDPPREEAKAAVARCKHAGIRPIMITGDHPATAAAIAAQLGLDETGRVATGHDLDDAGDGDNFVELVNSTSVYARVTAEHKQRVVAALKKRGQVVAMTGDGVNDAPAVSAADIGIAMGITGTDVTKSASDMVLVDDNFATIVNAVEEGRGIFDNIQKVVQYLLSTNAGEVIAMFAAALLGWPVPLLPIHLLWINLITDGLPALTLGMEAPEPGIMDRPPRPPREPLITRARGTRIVLYGMLFAFSIMLAYGLTRWYHGESNEVARTVAFCVACYAQMLFALGSRSDTRTFWQMGILTNTKLLTALFVSGTLQLGTILLPWGRRIFETTPLSVEQWGLVIAASLLPITVVELSKLFRSTR